MSDVADDGNNFVAQVRRLITGLSLSQQVGIVLAAVAVIGLLYGTVRIAGQEHYEMLFGGLGADDGTEIAARLREENVPYRLSPGGRAVEVPASRVDEMRLLLSSEGLPRGGGVGYELFDTSTFGMSDFVQNVNYRRAMERELARTIERLDAVSSARVHVVVPPEAIFVDEKREAKASVIVDLNRGRNLGSEEVAAIGHLVASAVEGLQIGRVTVVDTSGRVLSDGSGAGTVPALTGHQLGLKAQAETALRGKLIAMLEPIVGAGRVRARADVSLDFTQVQLTQEQFDPAGSVVRSEQRSKQKRTGAGAVGPPGTASNLAAGQGPAAGASPKEESSGKTINYEINRTVRNVHEQVGTIERLSVAVVVDNAPDPAAGAAGGRARTPDEMRKITALVQATVGYDRQRGDVLTVENIAFDTTGVADQGTAAAPGGRLWIEIARYVALAVVAVLVFMFLVKPSLRAMRGAMGPPQAGSSVGSLLVPDDVAELRRILVQISSEQPKGAARVLSAMISEERPS